MFFELIYINGLMFFLQLSNNCYWKNGFWHPK